MRFLATTCALLVAIAAALAAPSPTPATAGRPQNVIVVFSDAVGDPAAEAAELGRQHGFGARHVYTTALSGFAASLSRNAVAALQRNPRVLAIEVETIQSTADSVPTGIDRVEADRLFPGLATTNAVSVNLPVAVIDTGLYRHADLNVAGGFNATSGNRDGWGDGNGHGTHVAGTIAARDNGSGVVGVAPGAPVWGVRVCKTGNTCHTSDMVAGIDWIASRKAEANDGAADGDAGINFAAANMSLTSSDQATTCLEATPDAVHRAICGLVARGVVFVQAAANENRVKNAYPEAVSVSALADFNGNPGGGAAPTCRTDIDDTRADFSNYGPTTDIAAPGVCIQSTWNNGGYAVLSGTSMASPHVAGAVALYLYRNGLAPARNGAEVETLRAAVTGAALPQGDPCSFVSDKASAGSTEPLLFVNGAAFGGDGSCGAD